MMNESFWTFMEQTLPQMSEGELDTLQSFINHFGGKQWHRIAKDDHKDEIQRERLE